MWALSVDNDWHKQPLMVHYAGLRVPCTCSLESWSCTNVMFKVLLLSLASAAVMNLSQRLLQVFWNYVLTIFRLNWWNCTPKRTAWDSESKITFFFCVQQFRASHVVFPQVPDLPVEQIPNTQKWHYMCAPCVEETSAKWCFSRGDFDEFLVMLIWHIEN